MNTITLYVMTLKGFEVLSSLILKGYDKHISAVVIGRDKKIDNDFSAEIIALCEKTGIECHERNSGHIVESDYSIAISWRWIIGKNQSRLIVLHDSLLPKYRGFAPLVNALINGEDKIGVSAIYASSEYDKGEIISQRKVDIEYPIKINQAIGLTIPLYVELIDEIVQQVISKNELKSYKQDEKESTYSIWRDDEDYLIDWNQESFRIINFINALSSPYKGAATFINGSDKIRILEAEVVEDVTVVNRPFHIGKVIFTQDKFPVIVCKVGLLKITVAKDESFGESILPFPNFRIRLSNQK